MAQMRSKKKPTKKSGPRRDKRGRFRQSPQTVGRPTKYSPAKHPAQVEQALGSGLTVSEAASLLGISRSTLMEWIEKHPAFSEAVTRGKAVADELVEKSLYTRAIGYGYTQTQTIESEKPDKDGEPILATKTVRQEIIVPGDVNAQQFWLKNRQPANWREKQEVKHEGSIGVKPDLSGLTTEQLVALAAESKSREGEESEER